jgi:PHD/YefM family antitoxin component YafN of YafNO toxin-antitoxin module/mRNA-degrading endonuclease RelE of RelBE toxin-antitoxin system
MTMLEVSAAAPRLSELAAGVAAHGERVTLLDGGAPVAVLVRPYDLRALLESVELLSDRAVMQRISEGESAFQSGDVISGSDLGSLDPGGRIVHHATARSAAAPGVPADGHWEIAVSGPASRALAKLAPHIRDRVLHLMFDQLTIDPTRYGIELRGGLSRRYIAHVETEMVVYRLDTVKRAVRVIEVLRGGGLVGQSPEASRRW